MLRPFAIHEPATVEEASALLARLGPDAAVCAGGTELLLVMKEGLVHYPHLVNIKTVPGLDAIMADDARGILRVGALCTHTQLERSPLVRTWAPVLADTERRVANLRVRNVGTIGGNLAFAEPHSDPGAVLAALDSVIELSGTRGVRQVRAAEFFRGPFETAREANEILTAVEVPRRPSGQGAAYLKFGLHERPAVGVAAVVELEAGGISRAAVALGSVDPVPHRVPAAETLLAGRPPSDEVLDAAAAAAAEACDPVDDIHGSADYKRHLVRVLTRRALRQALVHARAGAPPARGEPPGGAHGH